MQTLDFPDEATVLDHGFRFRPIWWTSRVPIGWGDFLTQLPASERGYHHITRADLLAAPEIGLPQALLAGYVWGTGSSAFLVGRRARTFRDNDTARIDESLRLAKDSLQRGETIDAYQAVMRGYPGNLKHLGPSFYTKFLYAADSVNGAPGRALILDQFVAVALNKIDGWDIGRTGPWSAQTYERWIDHANRIAAANNVRADAVEMAYFEYGKKAA
ncbi:hypothetical protein V4U86_19215 [Mycobacterium sp. AMU20-3851]|uniref:8-oxoguanine DNA glycosylase OGG fold protein n=1 Tax=Mycobacterium sp. AMU20-3851 TaxID=3122055 RepID=UPI003754B985